MKRIIVIILAVILLMGCSSATLRNSISDDPNRTTIVSEKSYFRGMSWAGVGAVEGAMGDQGIQSDDYSVGKSKGQSWVVGAWKFIKGIIWFIIGYAVIWMILSALSLVFPPLGIVATIMGAIATGGLSLISTLFNWIKTKKTETALVQTVQGIDALKTEQPELKKAINTSLAVSQDTSSKAVIAKIRALK